jgi:hypothetical protein
MLTHDETRHASAPPYLHSCAARSSACINEPEEFDEPAAAVAVSDLVAPARPVEVIAQYTYQWLGSRVISAQKANAANDFSLGKGPTVERIWEQRPRALDC